MTWRFIVLRRSLFSLFFSPVRDALAGLLREYERHDQAAALMRDKLTELNINACSIGDSGAAIVADFLKHDETVIKAQLWGCNIGPPGAKAIAGALRQNKSVAQLGLPIKQIEGGGAEALIESLNYNVCVTETLIGRYHKHSAASQATIEYLTETRNKVLIPAAIRRASFHLIAALGSNTGAGTLAGFPKEIVRIIAVKVWATRKDPIWINALTESERTGKTSLCSIQ